MQYVTSSFTQISDSLMAAGQVFGGSPAYILRRITLPLIRQGIATGWINPDCGRMLRPVSMRERAMGHRL